LGIFIDLIIETLAKLIFHSQTTTLQPAKAKLPNPLSKETKPLSTPQGVSWDMRTKYQKTEMILVCHAMAMENSRHDFIITVIII
jgi:hypothetical protein